MLDQNILIFNCHWSLLNGWLVVDKWKDEQLKSLKSLSQFYCSVFQGTRSGLQPQFVSHLYPLLELHQ